MIEKIINFNISYIALVINQNNNAPIKSCIVYMLMSNHGFLKTVKELYKQNLQNKILH